MPRHFPGRNNPSQGALEQDCGCGTGTGGTMINIAMKSQGAIDNRSLSSINTISYDVVQAQTIHSLNKSKGTLCSLRQVQPPLPHPLAMLRLPRSPSPLPLRHTPGRLRPPQCRSLLLPPLADPFLLYGIWCKKARKYPLKADFLFTH